MGIHYQAHIGCLLVLDEEVLQFLNLVEELDCGVVAPLTPIMKEILGEEAPIPFKVATEGYISSLEFVELSGKLILI